MTDFTYSGTIALDTIAVSGIYGITAIGAAGGATSGAATGGSGGLGGLGAKVSGDIFLQAGSVLEIVAGGEGGESFAGGGGGGSFVIETNNGTSAVDIVLAVAGGGGGGGPIGTGGNGLTTENGGNGGGSLGSGGAGGSNGNGGAGGNAGGGGGGGINEDGGTSVDGPNGGGKDPANGFYGGVGGIETGSLGNGGYGGGGGAGFYTGGRYHGFGGGGGGGYGGGGGGAGTTGGSYGDRVSAGGGGGGGGSYYEDLIGGTATPGIGTTNGDVQITPLFPICYLAGTHILTPTGLAPVESLKIGDTVITRFSGIRPIKWIGRQTFAPHFIAPEKFPVRIAANALAENLPTRDLYVSPGHSMLLGDILILAADLINGDTITQTQPTEEILYFQLDLGTHDCILAEGAWSETYADAPGLRAQFHNAAEYDTLYPNDPPPEALTLCASRPDSGPRLESALRLLPRTRRMGGAPREAHA